MIIIRRIYIYIKSVSGFDISAQNLYDFIEDTTRFLIKKVPGQVLCINRDEMP